MKRTMPATMILALVLLAAVAMSGCTSGSISTDSGTVTPGAASATSNANAGLSGSQYNITIIGGNISPVTVTYADLESMNMVEMSHVTMVKMNNVNVTSDWVGVPTHDILAKAGVPDGNVTFKMSAADGFQSIYTPDQLKGTMLGLKKNGTVLNDDVNGDYPIQLVVPDQYGYNWIKVPVTIEVERA